MTRNISHLLAKIAFGMLLLSLALLSAIQETNALPMLTLECRTQDVVTPDPKSEEGQFDGGFLFSEDCGTIYVRPPRAGSVLLNGVAPTASINECPAVYNSMEALAKATANKNKAIDRISRALDSGDSAGVLDATSIATALQTVEDQVDRGLNKYSTIEGATASMLLEISYSELLSAYKKLNPTMIVQRLPIKAGVLSVKTLQLDPLNLQVAQKTRSGALEIVVAGLLQRNLEDFNVAAPDNQDTLTFGDSLTGSVKLSLIGACPFYDKDRGVLAAHDFTDRKPDYRAYLTASYTYFYPVQTKGTYTITFDANVVGDMVKKIVETHKGDVSAAVLAQDLLDIDTTEAFKITISQDLLNSMPSEETLRAQFKTNVASSFVQDLLSKLGTLTRDEQVPDIDVRFTGFRDEVQRARHCRSSGFLGLGSSCSDYVYTVKVPAEQIKTRTKEILADLAGRYSEESVKISTLIASGTAGFTIHVAN